MVALYTFIHLVHFYCTVSVILLYNDTIYHFWENSQWIRVKNLSLNIITKESIGIFIWELNKVHDMSIQSMCDKENEEVIKIFHKW